MARSKSNKEKAKTVIKERWYLEPLNSATNQTLSFMLEINCFHENKRDINGLSHNLWEVNISLRDYLLASRASDPYLDFRLFCEDVLSGDLAEVTQSRKKSDNKKQLHKDLQLQLKKMKALAANFAAIKKIASEGT